MKKGLAIAVVIILLVVVGWFLFNGTSDDKTEDLGGEDQAPSALDNSIAGESEVEESPMPETYAVRITSSGFSPETLEINQGDRVVFLNEDTSRHWPASDVHPTHRNYPGSGIEKCDSDARESIFDACHGLNRGERYEFVFLHAGGWRYHDHLNPSLGGEIIVR